MEALLKMSAPVIQEKILDNTFFSFSMISVEREIDITKSTKALVRHVEGFMEISPKYVV